MDNFELLGCEAVPHGLVYRPPVVFFQDLGISPADLLGEILAHPVDDPVQEARSFGSGRMANRPYPPLMRKLASALQERGIHTDTPNYSVVVTYDPSRGQATYGLPFHVDNKLTNAKEIVSILTLGGDRVLRFRSPPQKRLKVLLESMSLLTIQGAAASQWEHAYCARWHADTGVRDFDASESFRGIAIPARHVYSVTFRDCEPRPRRPVPLRLSE